MNSGEYSPQLQIAKKSSKPTLKNTVTMTDSPSKKTVTFDVNNDQKYSPTP